MKTILYSSVIAGLAMSSPAWAALVPEDKADCESLGYTVDFDECLAQKAMPLLCPFYSVNNKKVACIINSCRGYPLKESDFAQTMSDGQPLSAHIDGDFVPEQTESAAALGCRAGWEKSGGTLKEVWYYKIKKCKDSSRFQNDKCDVGCDKVNKYPYSSHPGDLAGEVDNCVDKDGTWFGYKSCNDGWYLSSGRCELSSCEIKDYPYMGNPNLEEDRGLTKTCKIGGNTYYRYTGVDSQGNALTNGGCSNKGYTLVNAVCAKNCEIGDCVNEVKEVSYTADDGTVYKRKYNEWSCKTKTANCRVGDYAVIDGQQIGIIFHLPDAKLNKTLVAANRPWAYFSWSADAAQAIDTPLANPGANKNDFEGKYRTNWIINFARSNANYKYPAFTSAITYEPANCNHSICKAGEWYLFSIGEAELLYENKYLMYNLAHGSNRYHDSFDTWTSNEWGSSDSCFRAEATIYCWPKSFHYNVTPVLSFSPR